MNAHIPYYIGGGLRSSPSTVNLNASLLEYDPATSRSSLPRVQSSISTSDTINPSPVAAAPGSVASGESSVQTSKMGPARTSPDGETIQEPPLET